MGIPNITGNLYGFCAPGRTSSQFRTGAFKDVSSPYNTGVWAAGGANYQVEVNFDASRLSSIYGNSNVVTPLSLSILYILKY